MTDMKPDWTNVWGDDDEDRVVSLKEMEVGSSATFNFSAVRQTRQGFIVATVESEEIEGTTMWLKGKFGPQNGLLSLLKAAGDGDNIEGNTYTLTKIESENSPTGYAFMWTS